MSSKTVLVTVLSAIAAFAATTILTADTPAKPSEAVVHEWGTFTTVHTSEGRQLSGLHLDEELLPGHEANMMHTIRSLRNLVVHENVDFGEHETTIARAAWHIIRAWAERQEAEAWKLATNMCKKAA